MNNTIEKMQSDSISSLGIGWSYLTAGIGNDKKVIAEKLVANCSYLYSVYNASTKETIAQVFISGNYLVKVFNDNSVEFYVKDYIHNGFKYDYVSFGSGITPLEYYKANENGNSFSKYDIVTNEKLVDTYSGNYHSIPEDKKQLLSDFNNNHAIFAWSDKSYGFIVEYIETQVN